MKLKSLIRIQFLLLFLSIFATGVYAMDLQPQALAPNSMVSNSSETAGQNQTDNDNDAEDTLAYPGRISLILGYSRVGIKDAKIDNLSVTPLVRHNQLDLPNTTYSTKSSDLNGIKIGLNQFITKHFGYEVNINYYLSQKNEDDYNGEYQPGNGPGLPATTVASKGTVNNKLLTAELMGMAGLHLTHSILVVAKLGVGYVRFSQDYNITSTFNQAGTPVDIFGYNPVNDKAKNNKFGIAGELALRFDLNDNFSLSFGVNDLHANKNFMAYQAGLLMRL